MDITPEAGIVGTVVVGVGTAAAWWLKRLYADSRAVLMQHASALKTLNTELASQLQAVNDAHMSQLQAVNDAHMSQLQAVNDAHAAQIQKINDAHAAQIQAISLANIEQIKVLQSELKDTLLTVARALARKEKNDDHDHDTKRLDG